MTPHNSPCHNPIFTPEIFSGVGAQNRTVQTRPDQPNRDPSFQNDPRMLPRAPLPKFEEVWPNSTRVDQVWLGLTEVWPRVDQAISDLTWVQPGYISRTSVSLTKVWLRLTKFDQGLTGPLTRPEAESNWPLPDHSEEHDNSFDSTLYGPKTDEKRGSYGQNCEKTVQHLAKFC